MAQKLGPKHARSQSCPTKLNTLALFLVPLLPLPRMSRSDRDRQRFKSSSASSGTAGVAAVVFLDPRISRYSKNSSIVINAVDFIVISMCFPP